MTPVCRAVASSTQEPATDNRMPAGKKSPAFQCGALVLMKLKSAISSTEEVETPHQRGGDRLHFLLRVQDIGWGAGDDIELPQIVAIVAREAIFRAQEQPLNR